MWRSRHFSSRAARNLLSLADETVTVGQPPRVLVSNLSLQLSASERWAIVGANGCGKSSTAHHIGRGLEGDAAFISFEAHRQLLSDENTQFNESRFTVVHKRATVASFLFPELHPVDPDHPEGYTGGYRPPATCLSPIAVPYDAGSAHPALEELEAACRNGRAEWLLRELNLFDLRHQPVFGLSTGEARKMMLIGCLLSPRSLLVLDEAFDGLDVKSRHKLRDVLTEVLDADEWKQSALALITHRREDYEGLKPTHGLVLGEGDCGTLYSCGVWAELESQVTKFFDSQHDAEQKRSKPKPKPKLRATSVTSNELSKPLIQFNQVSIRYPTSVVFEPPLTWTVNEGEKWVVAGGNGSGKSTLLQIVTGENMLAYQQDVQLFGKKKGSGESIWDIKKQLGELSTEFHMKYIDYADPTIRGFANKPSGVSNWEVVCSGFFDSVGLYEKVSLEQQAMVQQWVERLGVEDMIAPPRANKELESAYNFFHLSHGQQKLVLLCRAMVKMPRLLLLDEPTHGLSGHNRDRLLAALGSLVHEPDVAIVYVTHRSDEVEALGFENVLQLSDRTEKHSLQS